MRMLQSIKMGELHSLAYTNSLHSSSLGWDFHSLGVPNAETMSLGTYHFSFLISLFFCVFFGLSINGSWMIYFTQLVNAFCDCEYCLVMDGKGPFYSPLEPDFSTGYLEDALLEFSERTKRRRLLLYTDDHESDSSMDLEKVFLFSVNFNDGY